MNKQAPGIARVLILLSALFAVEGSLADEFPSWLAGKADLEMVEERNKLYEWIFEQADGQTNGMASREALARKRLINLANKLAVNYSKTDQKDFSVELTYLVLDSRQPTHFKFFIRRETLQHLLSR